MKTRKPSLKLKIYKIRNKENMTINISPKIPSLNLTKNDLQLPYLVQIIKL